MPGNGFQTQLAQYASYEKLFMVCYKGCVVVVRPVEVFLGIKKLRMFPGGSAPVEVGLFPRILLCFRVYQ